MASLVNLATGVGLVVLGVCLGFVLPSFVRIYRLTQLCYGKGYENGRSTYGALVRRALGKLDDCDHMRETPLGNAVCAKCAAQAKTILQHCQGPID